MNAAQRREKILQQLHGASAPISASALAAKLGVSRQIVVGDVALLRAGGAQIDATPRGYQLHPAEKGYTGILACVHRTEDEMRPELYTNVDQGGVAVDVAVENSLDDPERAYAVTRDMLRSHPEIDAMFVVTAGCEGVCRALISAGRAGEIRVVGYDDVPATREMMRLGIVRAVVCQQPFEQGYRSLRAAFDMVLSGEMMDDRRIIMENQIKLLENLSPAPQDLPFQD